MLLRMSNSIMPGKGDTYWNLEWAVPLEWVSYFVCLGEGEFLNLHWDPTVLLQPVLVEIYYACNGACTIEKGKKMEALIWHILSPVHLLMLDSAASLGQHV